MTTENWTIVGIGITAFIVCGSIWRAGIRQIKAEKARIDELMYEAKWWQKHATIVFEEAKDAAQEGRYDLLELKLRQHDLCYRRFQQIKIEIEKLTA